MKRAIFLFGAITTPGLVEAVEIELQPRFDAGGMYYEFKQFAFAESSNLPITSPLGRFRTVTGESTLSDIMPFVGGGVSIFSNRFFVDFYVQHGFEGDDEARFSTSSTIPASTVPTLTTDLSAEIGLRQESEFDRTEFAVSVGYSITDHLAIYAGYKRAETNFENRIAGEVATFESGSLSADPFLSGTLTGDLKTEVDYDGPFIGANITWPVKLRFADGALSGNVGVAFLDGESNLRPRNFVLVNNVGFSIPLAALSVPDPQPESLTNLKGDAVGLTFGLTWRGFTPIKDLTYSFGISGYQYNFTSDRTQDFTETVVRVSLGLAYAFGH